MSGASRTVSLSTAAITAALVAAPPTPAAVPADTARLEALAYDLVVAERKRNGLRQLTRDPELDRSARAHAEAMRDLKFFGHRSPVTRLSGLPDRLAAAGVSDTEAAENVGLYGSGDGAKSLADRVRRLHDDLMKSPPHRDNLLQAGFDRIGVGIAVGVVEHHDVRHRPLLTVWIAQHFVSRRVTIHRATARASPGRLELDVAGVVHDPSSIGFSVRPPRGRELIRPPPIKPGAFRRRLSLPAGRGVYELLFRRHPDRPGGVVTCRLLVDTSAPPRRAVMPIAARRPRSP